MTRYCERKNINQKEMGISEITPVILGGDPMDAANKIVLTRQQHIDACRYWNKIIQDLRSKSL